VEPTEPLEAPDGRRARSDRTRAAIVDALLALLTEGQLRPSAERIAERAGISRRALFNHFRDVEDLLATAAQRRLEQILPTLRPLPTEGALPERARATAALLCGLYERVAPVRRAALHVEPESPVIAERMRDARRMHRASLEAAFAPELAAHPEVQRADLTALLCALTSFPMWDELTTRQGVPAARAPAVIERQILGALAPREDSASSQGPRDRKAPSRARAR
jgi:TetR/AcrR family transcriptional regulator of autoinduction and epiphytic fitness